MFVSTNVSAPHWGKLHHLDAATLAPRYPRWREFLDARAALDPERRFANGYLTRLLDGIVAPPAYAGSVSVSRA